MSLRKLPLARVCQPVPGNTTLLVVLLGPKYQRNISGTLRKRQFSSQAIKWSNTSSDNASKAASRSETTQSNPPSNPTSSASSESKPGSSSTSISSQEYKPVKNWDDDLDFNISTFAQLPGTNFGVNQHMIINTELKEALRQILWQFRAPIRYAFAYGSGVFPQSKGTAPSTRSVHPSPPKGISRAQSGEGKMIDFIFGVSYTQHWHSLNLQQHRDHYSAVGSLGSYAVSKIQDRWGAGVYFNPYVTVNGTLIKYGVVNLDTLCRDLSTWDTLYLAGRLQKPVKILRDDPRVRLANQVNLLSALRTALLLLPTSFTEEQLYGTIAGISYMGDIRMTLPTENPHKVANIVRHQLSNFRRLYAPLIDNLPNVVFNDSRCSDPRWADDESLNVNLEQDMDPMKRGNMVRRLPKAFREKLYFEYQKKFQMPRLEFNKLMEESNDDEIAHRPHGGRFEQRIAADETGIKDELKKVIKKTIGYPSTVQSFKGLLTAGIGRTIKYMREKSSRFKEGEAKKAAERLEKEAESSESEAKEDLKAEASTNEAKKNA